MSRLSISYKLQLTELILALLPFLSVHIRNQMEQTPKAFPVCLSCPPRLSYLHVSTCSLICAFQLAFNALFSFILNSQKFTPYVSTLSSCSPSPLSSLCFKATPTLQTQPEKVIRKETFTAVMDVIVCQVASFAILVGRLVSGEWKVWLLFAICGVGLIFEASSLFSNVVGTLGLPVVPVLPVIFFHDKMDRIKVVAMVLAIWGFVYLYQHYLDDHMTAENENAICER
ncbi:hypothetical protein PRUPE_4G179200 [Prunus persica]|uniref:Uncharacterized protein n=1 Tax=Prunus persica TaxID=3760 RepID=M5X1L6_PRUPE|nr:hypothetical protein PRUPE_4G179200 [Prunus persica]